jgi:aconitate hydratase
VTRRSLELTGAETIDVPDVSAALTPGARTPVRLNRIDGRSEVIEMISRVDTRREADWVRAGGVLSYVLQELAAA